MRDPLPTLAVVVLAGACAVRLCCAPPPGADAAALLGGDPSARARSAIAIAAAAAPVAPAVAAALLDLAERGALPRTVALWALRRVGPDARAAAVCRAVLHDERADPVARGGAALTLIAVADREGAHDEIRALLAAAPPLLRLFLEAALER